MEQLPSQEQEPITVIEEEKPTSQIDRYAQIVFTTQGEQLYLILPKTNEENEGNDWTEILEGTRYYLKNSGQNIPEHTFIQLIARERLLDTRQLQTLAEVLETEAKLVLKTVHTTRRQTAVAAATAGYCVEQYQPQWVFSFRGESGSLGAEPLYLKTNVRSGREICHPGTVVILGDVNPGGTIIADGDIFIWGCLRGIAHAGASGNFQSLIMALRMEATQVRIAHLLARISPIVQPTEPEVAYISNNTIQVTPAYKFSKTHISDERGGWLSQ
ncbi:MAG: septum site-determining protein MinC [Chlorogloea purpurea SAG 13.99]|nr:septum site-determining protein MinC [Chlorogloea purpurea SAG 13.99]